MTDVEFERLLSHTEAISSTPCIRDLIFNHYERIYPLYSPASIDRLTKNYIDRLFKTFVNRKM